MNLSLSIPTSWPVRSHAEHNVAIVSPDVVLAWGWLVPFPDQPNPWVQRAMHADVAPPATVKAGAHQTRSTRTGWSFKTLDAEVLLDGVVAEYRLGAFFHFLEYGAVALVRAKSREALDLVRTSLLEVLETGAPDWQANRLPVSLQDLFRD